jgi:hypothetical protein
VNEKLTDLIAQAIGDPGSIVGRRLGPSWGEGNAGYAPKDEPVVRWSTRAVMVVLTQGSPVPQLAVRFAQALAVLDWDTAAAEFAAVHAADPQTAVDLLRVAMATVATEGQRKGRDTVITQIVDTVAPGSTVIGARIDRIG